MTPTPRDVSALILDCDGVLTDGCVWVDDDGRESRRFSVRDGYGIALWKHLGLKIAVISGRGGASLRHRMASLGVHDVVQSAPDKATAVADAAARLGVSPSQCAFVGDDWPDLPAFATVGYPIAVADAAREVRQGAAFITTARGGEGAVREAIEHILDAKGLLAGGAAAFGNVRSKGFEGPTAG